MAVIEGHDEWGGNHEKFWTLREIHNGAAIIVEYGSIKLSFVVTSHYAECKAPDVPAADCKARNTQGDVTVWNWDHHVSEPQLAVITCNPTLRHPPYYSDNTGNHAYDNEVVHARLVSVSG